MQVSHDIPDIPHKRNRSPSVESILDEDPGTYFLSSGIACPFSLLRNNYLLLEINKHIPRLESRELKILFVKRHPSKVFELRDQLTRNCRITEHSRNSALSTPEISSRMTEIMQSLEGLIASVKPVKKEKNAWITGPDHNNEESKSSEIEMLKNERLMDRVRQKAHELIGDNYKNFARAFAMLAYDRQIRHEFIEDDSEGIFSLQVFYLVWFILTELSMKTLKNHYKVLCEMDPESLQKFFEMHDSCNPILKSKSLNLLFTALFAQDSVPEPHLCVRDAFAVYKGQKVVKFKNYYPSSCNQFLSILIQKRFKSYFATRTTKYKRFIMEVIENTYFCDLPQGLDGLTLFNRRVIISTTDKEKIINKQSSVFWGFSFVTLLRQTLLLVIKKKLMTDKEWFEYIIPEETITKDRKGFEKALFGKALDYIAKKGAKFILDHNKWNLTAPAFTKGFLSYNKTKKKLLATLSNRALIWFGGSSTSNKKILMESFERKLGKISQNENKAQ